MHINLNWPWSWHLNGNFVDLLACVSCISLNVLFLKTENVLCSIMSDLSGAVVT